MELEWKNIEKDGLPKDPDLYLVINNGLPLVKGWDGVGWREHQMTTPLYENDENITNWTYIEVPKEFK